MLVLSRKEGERIVIELEIAMDVFGVYRGKVIFGPAGDSHSPRGGFAIGRARKDAALR